MPMEGGEANPEKGVEQCSQSGQSECRRPYVELLWTRGVHVATALQQLSHGVRIANAAISLNPCFAPQSSHEPHRTPGGARRP